MKKLVIAILFVFSMRSVFAQTNTYACQFIQAAGMIKKNQQDWVVSEFAIPEPFFLKTFGGVIDTKSVENLFLVGVDKCSSTTSADFWSIAGIYHQCMSSTSGLFSFSESTLYGSVANTYGAMLANKLRPDTVTVSRFKCQLVRQ